MGSNPRVGPAIVIKTKHEICLPFIIVNIFINKKEYAFLHHEDSHLDSLQIQLFSHATNHTNKTVSNVLIFSLHLVAALACNKDPRNSSPRLFEVGTNVVRQ
mmetsp:Transcript_9169/g.16417  ORF Transcript_9169/g.16417 Transcript_9169/m.16417 type:complete len:102 (+) Transcript_9169:41-346(+)